MGKPFSCGSSRPRAFQKPKIPIRRRICRPECRLGSREQDCSVQRPTGTSELKPLWSTYSLLCNREGLSIAFVLTRKILKRGPVRSPSCPKYTAQHHQSWFGLVAVGKMPQQQCKCKITSLGQFMISPLLAQSPHLISELTILTTQNIGQRTTFRESCPQFGSRGANFFDELGFIDAGLYKSKPWLSSWMFGVENITWTGRNWILWGGTSLAPYGERTHDDSWLSAFTRLPFYRVSLLKTPVLI